MPFVSNKIKKFITQRFTDFTFFFRYLRYRVFIAVVLSMLIGVLDGLGLTMFLPLLQMVGGADTVDGSFLGNLRFITDAIENLGINLTLFSVVVIMVVFFLVKGAVIYMGMLYKIGLNQLFIKKIRKGLLQTFNSISFKYFVQSDVGRIQNSMTGEVDRVAIAFREYFKTVEQAILVAIYIAFALVVDWFFAILVIVGGALINILYQRFYKKTKEKSKEFTAGSHSYQGLIIQYIANFKYLKATSLLGVFSKKLNDTVDEIEYSRRKIGEYAAILAVVREGMMITVISLMIFIQIVVLKGTIQGIILSLLFFYKALGSLMQLQGSWNRYLEVSGSVDNIREFQEELKINKEQVQKKELSGFLENIRLSQVNFAYGKTPVLNQINLEIEKNKTVAFVGESGSGKTTLVNILSGLIPVDSGKLLIDGKNLYDYNVSSFQKRMGYITQDPVIFNDSVFNNITFWAEESPENYNRFKTAMEMASIFEFIDELPEKHHTLLGHNGINLSGGQKQRISIARELYKDIEILIMDEATSALDSETEKSIQENIDNLKGKFTILIVAHRLSTIRNADRIVLMNKGQIAASGNYETLVRENENFAHMVRLQEL